MHNFQNKKIAFFGTPHFTVEFLELFKFLNLDLQLIVTGEDKPVGRGLQMQKPAPAKWAQQNRIKYLQPKKLSEIENELQDFDLFIVIAYGKIIAERIINLPKYGTINLHYSLLPKYRGASPVESAILNGDTETGISIQQMVYKLDAGNILLQVEMPIEETETTSELRDRLNKKALEIFPGFLEEFFIPSPDSGNLTPSGKGGVQDESQATSCGKFEKEDMDVTADLKSKNMDVIYRKFKAFDKKIYFTFIKKDGQPLQVKITDMRKTPGGLQIEKLLPESKKEITLKDFQNSYGTI